ncbi:MAG: hypothetical protein IJH32_01290 [Ruminococcus sp.]|nr:hypothetical protein [Ruminococcus sp.]
MKRKSKGYLKRTIKLLSLLLCIFVCVYILQYFFFSNADNNSVRIHGFYLEDKDSLDVVIIGASESYYDYSPGYAYDQYGFTSYAYGTPSTTIFNYKTMLKEVLRKQNPKVIFIELNGAYYDDAELDDKINLRNYTDHIPINQNKIELINRCVEDDKLEYYFPIVKFHAIWKDYPSGLGWTISMFENQFRGYSALKGIRTKIETHAYKESSQVGEVNLNKRVPLNRRAETALRDLLQFCKDEKLDNVVFGRMPHNVEGFNVMRFQRSNATKDIVEEYGFDFVCFDVNGSDSSLDITKDFFNLEHLNIYGQRKFTDEFSQYLMEHYGVTPSDLTDRQKVEWKDSARYYYAYYDLCDYLYTQDNSDYICEDYRNVVKMKEYLTPMDEFTLGFESKQ